MTRITINVGTHGVETTASEMRKRLAQVLSKIPGDQVVFFNLTLHLENYSPITPEQARRVIDELYEVGESHSGLLPPMVYGELARPEND